MAVMPASATRARSGKGGRIVWNTKVLLLQEWSTTERGDDEDTTSFEDRGNETGLTGVGVLEFTFRGNWDAGQNMLDDPPGIYPRPDGGPCQLYENVGDNVFWNVPCVRVLQAQQTNGVRSPVTFSASCKSNGAWSRPSGSIAGAGAPLGNLT